jgi:ribosomal protein L21
MSGVVDTEFGPAYFLGVARAHHAAEPLVKCSLGFGVGDLPAKQAGLRRSGSQGGFALLVDTGFEFGEVLLTDMNGDVQIGTPYLPTTTIKATVLSHLKGDKVIVFKKKRRKGYKKKNGHRQYFTKIRIDAIN